MFRAGDTGKAIFVPLESLLSDVRKSTALALRKQQPLRAFQVTCEWDYFGNCLELELFQNRENLLPSLDGLIDFSTEGKWRCAALTQQMGRRGILLHREGEELLCAYTPLLDRAQAEKEHAMAMTLSFLAKAGVGMNVRLERDFRTGEYELGMLLELLSEAIEV